MQLTKQLQVKWVIFIGKQHDSSEFHQGSQQKCYDLHGRWYVLISSFLVLIRVLKIQLYLCWLYYWTKDSIVTNIKSGTIALWIWNIYSIVLLLNILLSIIVARFTNGNFYMLWISDWFSLWNLYYIWKLYSVLMRRETRKLRYTELCENAKYPFFENIRTQFVLYRELGAKLNQLSF